jgi:glycosyltransferase involved in cell wall biosynthesis
MVHASGVTLRVLAFPAFASRGNNPYTSSLYDALQRLGVEVDEYAALPALTSAYSILHVHWPEVPLNRGRLSSVLGSRLFLRLIDVTRARGAKLVWTVHNLRSHEQRCPAREAWFFREFVARVDGFIALTHTGEEAVRARFPGLTGKPCFVIPHHHYRGAYLDGIDRAEARRELGLDPERRVLLFFGRVMAYKNLPELTRVTRAASAGDWTLLIAGRPKTDRDERELREAAANDPRIRLELEFIQPERARYYFRAADLVVLPYREILNSGAAVLGLSFDRPVLLPDLGACRELGEQVGRDWVRTYLELSPEVLASALDHARTLPEHTDGTQLAAIDVARTARQTLDAYRTLIAR